MRWRVCLILLTVLGCRISCLGQNSGSALAEIKAAADAGDPAAQDKLAQQFILRTDTKQAEFWYRKAAEQGYAHAQGKLGDMLLNRSRISINGTPVQRAAMSDEALKWATLAANQGDKRGQADLASICLEGKLVKPDLIEAYKWGDLAAQGSMLDPATISGRSTRDSAILKMTPDQISEAKKRVAAFIPHIPGKDELPEPAWVGKIKLAGLSGAGDRRLAIISGTTFSQGETASVKVAGRTVKVHCMEIRENSVLVEVDGLDKPHELFLAGAKP
jgi:hypothetical protein